MNPLSHLIPLAVLLLTLTPFVASLAEPKKPTSLEAGGLRFPLAKGWTLKKAPRTMSAGGMTYKTDDNEKGLDADFYHFGKGQGGSVAANIARWKGQFQGKPKEVETAKLAEGKIEFLHLEGTFLSGPPFGKKTPLKDHAMLAAMLQGKDGPVFVKMTGPKQHVAKTSAAFKALVESAFKD